MIKATSPKFWNDIRNIYVEGIKTENATFESLDNIKDYSEWRKSKIEDSCFVFLRGHTVCGWSALSSVSSRCVYSGVAEVSVYVGRGSNGKGIGSMLLKALIDYAEKNNIWTLQAGIFPENTSSIALHKKFGFRKVGYREKIGKMNGVWRDTLLFEKRSKNIL